MIERASGIITGYAGVDWFDWQGAQRLEFGWRLAPEYRGLGYATEAAQALLDEARRTFIGEIFVIIDLENLASQNVCPQARIRIARRDRGLGASEELVSHGVRSSAEFSD